jgi:predicted HTH transcriptional regulator
MSENLIDRSFFRAIDSLPVRDAGLDLIDVTKVEAHIARAVERGRYHGPTNPIEYLKQKRCLVVEGEASLATPAGILCFGHQPQEIFPRAVVDLVHYHGVDAVSFEVMHLEKDVGGTIFDQIARIEAYLWTNTHHGMTMANTSAQRIELHEYPRVVIRELVVNMVAHRDYANALSASRALLFRNRIEWLNPGGLPAGVTIKDILAAQAARNPVILSVLYESGYVEAIGQGIDTVVTVLSREGMAPPRFDDTGSFFHVTVFGKPPERFYDNEIYGQLNERQRRILSFIRTQRDVSPGDVVGLFDNTVTTRSVQRDIKVLADANLITVSGTGRGRGVRYRIQDDVS